MPFLDDEGERIDDGILSDMVKLMSDEGVRQLLRDNPDLAREVVANELTERDIIGLGYRKQQLEVFERLLEDGSFFDEKKREWEKTRTEDVWQHFFEQNTWIFGYGLQYIFASEFETTGRRTLKQMIRGSRIGQSGKEADGLLRTLGLISSMCFVEIKRHNTDLLRQVNPLSAHRHLNISHFMGAGHPGP